MMDSGLRHHDLRFVEAAKVVGRGLEHSARNESVEVAGHIHGNGQEHLQESVEHPRNSMVHWCCADVSRARKATEITCSHLLPQPLRQ
jgi:hypothetical protein